MEALQEDSGVFLSQVGGGLDTGTKGFKKMIAEHPVAHKEGHYRCFLPNLAGFMNRCCTGPGYQTGIYGVCIWTEREKFFNKAQGHFSSFIFERIYIPAPGPIVKKI